jgi:hypothetical protein
MDIDAAMLRLRMSSFAFGFGVVMADAMVTQFCMRFAMLVSERQRLDGDGRAARKRRDVLLEELYIAEAKSAVWKLYVVPLICEHSFL